MASYYVIDGRDGDVTIHKYTKKELLQILHDDEAYEGVEFVEMEEGSWQQVAHFGDNAVMVIRGADVVPAAKHTTVVWEVD